MKPLLWLTAMTLPVLAVSAANAEIIKGVLGIKGAEMS
jgi:hypothetical protein